MTLPPTIALTGADGFVGWHLRCRLKAMHPGVGVRLIERGAFRSDSDLRRALAGVGALVHLAGANRGSDDDVRRTNTELADKLVQALDQLGERPRVAFANSTQADRPTGYGTSKRDAGETLQAWGRRNGAAVADLLLPNLFGECGRPHYNSVVATFCAELAAGRPSTVDSHATIKLLPVQEACALLLDSVDNGADGFDGARRVQGQALSVSEVYDRLRRLHSSYGAAELPELQDRLDLLLFNALRTAMYPEHYPMPLTTFRDARGVFAEIARGSGQTQTSFSTTAPGHTRGEHFHFEKVERFAVVSGNAVIKVRKLFSRAVASFAATGGLPVVVDMPPLHAHSITNVGTGPLVTVFWSNDHFDASAADTYAEPVEESLVAAAS